MVDTFSLCVFPDPLEALKEMARVTKEETGRVLLLENSRSTIAPLGWYQDVTSSAIAKTGGKACVWNQDVINLARKAGLEVVTATPVLGGVFMLLEAKRKQF